MIHRRTMGGYYRIVHTMGGYYRIVHTIFEPSLNSVTKTIETGGNEWIKSY